MQKSDYSRTSWLRTYRMYGSTSERLVNTYSMIVRHSSCFMVLWIASLALLRLPSENAEVRFIFASIVTRGWIMHARKVVNIVFCCKV